MSNKSPGSAAQRTETIRHVAEAAADAYAAGVLDTGAKVTSWAVKTGPTTHFPETRAE